MKQETHSLKLSPADLQLEVERGTRLQDVLFGQGVEFPCGGRGRCKGCRVKVLRGALDVTAEEKKLLTRAELDAGWRLACRHSLNGDLELELAQWEMSVLSDESKFAFTPREGLSVAIDLGTTTIAAQLLDLRTGNVLGVRTSLNAQARHGGDIMSRVEFALHGGQAELQRLVREQLGEMVAQLLEGSACKPRSRRREEADARELVSNPLPHVSGCEELKRIVIVGNTVMHHLFCGINIAPLSVYPFEPTQAGRVRLAPRDLGWNLPDAAVVEFLPCLGGFVGSDILAGIVATGLHESLELMALMDLGTNGEVVVGNRERMLCTSTAAGPAFEGARISMGMRASTGAISAVQVENNSISCRVIGGGEPRGLCGSGLVDAVAAGLELEWIHPSGRMANRKEIPLAGPVLLSATDVRELQLAKGAIAAGLRMLTARLGASLEDIEQLHLAGAFGNYITHASAQRIGLLRVPLNRVTAAGNAALHGAKRALFEEAAPWDATAKRVEHLALNEDPDFHDIYAEEMRFPG
ncbi:MAG: ASKHA domain-containing protein [Verrucomicrobia bacterium]|jgi:uncharacterized 2Fe-2S/4Fe-4S cluster protein (DUF4445 family)|nr:ASKHA domain-containing protein [Verrucomicrobiota bacterium]